MTPEATFAVCVHLRTGAPSTNNVKEEKTEKKEGRERGKEGEGGKERKGKGKKEGGKTGKALYPASRPTPRDKSNIIISEHTRAVEA